MGFRLDTAYDELLDQFRNSTGILSFLEAVFNRIEDTDQVLADLLTKRDLESAEGVWLDYIGAIVGFPRFAEYIPAENTFTVKDDPFDPDDQDLGFADGPPITYGGYFQTINGTQVTDGTLADDDTYRTFLKAKIASTNASPSLPSIGRFITKAFAIDFTITVPVKGYIVIELESGVSPDVRFAIKRFAPVAGGVDLYVV